MRPDDVGLGGFDSHALPPSPRPRAAGARRVARRAAALAALAAVPALAGAQVRDTTRTRPDSARPPVVRDTTPPPAARRVATRRDSLTPPISPRRAFLASALVPGYAQARLGRPTAGALFVAVELTAIAMATKSAFDLRYARARARDTVVSVYRVDESGRAVVDPTTGLPVAEATARNRYAGTRVKARRTHYEDWIAALVFNHLFAGADAFVAAQLWDLPQQVSFRAGPGSVALSASIPW